MRKSIGAAVLAALLLTGLGAPAEAQTSAVSRPGTWVLYKSFSDEGDCGPFGEIVVRVKARYDAFECTPRKARGIGPFTQLHVRIKGSDR
ncbi:hypothetical protein [Salininema proteolyticum]|uniref:Uncharacterized protein n=1 Tax=Salininema proteolyticum TaxID=1607685 RepID=A0ABV8TWH4_9ACTN